jgi:hypothetical protein
LLGCRAVPMPAKREPADDGCIVGDREAYITTGDKPKRAVIAPSDLVG